MIHFRDEGEGRPLVLLHGLGASARVFDPLFARRGDRRFISVDLPRTARSGHWADSTPRAIADVLLKFLDSRQVSSFELFGHSFGGLVALQLAASVPARVLKLTVASAPAMGLPTELRLLLANPFADMTMSWFGRFPVWRPALRSYLSMIWGDAGKLSDLHLSLYEEALRAPGFNEGMLEALRAVGDFKLPAVELARAPFEKRLIWGEKDRLVSPIVGEQLAAAIGGRLTVWNGVGHCVPEEAPDGLFIALTR
jgi:pimeloyl-ACP methyl ester carboxylesterase